jgi:hypothetical protein
VLSQITDAGAAGPHRPTSRSGVVSSVQRAARRAVCCPTRAQRVRGIESSRQGLRRPVT